MTEAPTRRGLREDLPVLLQLLRGKPRGLSHADGLNAFYGPQARVYDHFRDRLLPGRQALMTALPLTNGARAVDLGAGTARHWLFVEERLGALARLDLVDLCGPLLQVAADRFRARGNVATHLADAETFRAGAPVDVVVFSYSLTMMEDWQAAVRNACGQLRPDGVVAVVDFYTLPLDPPLPLAALSRWDRWFWPRWFAHDGVRLRPELLPTLLSLGKTLRVEQGRTPVPYLPGFRIPWFLWVGRPERRDPS
ncbi:MAG TPA: class I SAM-dependent methyltransferase [Spirochaetia bacterium]|nr:class I SAM-dependent methyltransferase [Spirochaetia bacterium]